MGCVLFFSNIFSIILFKLSVTQVIYCVEIPGSSGSTLLQISSWNNIQVPAESEQLVKDFSHLYAKNYIICMSMSETLKNSYIAFSMPWKSEYTFGWVFFHQVYIICEIIRKVDEQILLALIG